MWAGYAKSVSQGVVFAEGGVCDLLQVCREGEERKYSQALTVDLDMLLYTVGKCKLFPRVCQQEEPPQLQYGQSNSISTRYSHLSLRERHSSSF